MGRHRFGEGEYRYFNAPYPEPIERLKQALYPRMLPIARDWYEKLGRPAPWPEALDEWLEQCHAAVSATHGYLSLRGSTPRAGARPSGQARASCTAT